MTNESNNLVDYFNIDSNETLNSLFITIAPSLIMSMNINDEDDEQQQHQHHHHHHNPHITNDSNDNGMQLNITHVDIINYTIVQATFGMLYVTIFVLGVFGNVLVCYVVFRNKAMQTVTNIFITNLALSDILLCVLAVPFTPLYTFLRRWVFGTALCHLVPYAQGCSVYISTLTLTSIAIDRFFVIIYPFQPRMKLSTCAMIIVSIWGFSLFVTLPYGLYVKVFAYNYTGIVNNYCEEVWPSEHYRKVFGSVTTTLQFILPFVIISLAYVCVSIKLNDRAKAKPGSKTSRREEADRDRKKRTNSMLISMVAVFGISWLPLNIVNIFNDFYTKTEDWEYYNLTFFVSHCIAMSSTCYNPFLYAWLNENFRKEFKQVLPCIVSASSRPNSLPGSRAWRPDRTCNGNNESMQETLLVTTTTSISKPLHKEIIPRGPTQEYGMRTVSTPKPASPPLDITLTPTTQATMTSNMQQVDAFLLSEETPRLPPPCLNQATIILPSGVLETPFEINTTQLPCGSNLMPLYEHQQQQQHQILTTKPVNSCGNGVTTTTSTASTTTTRDILPLSYQANTNLNENKIIDNVL